MLRFDRCPRRRASAFTLIELLVVIAIIGVLIGLLLPAVQKVREAANRAKCENNLKQLGLAMHNYHDTYSLFPPNSSPSTGAVYGNPAWSSWLHLSAFYLVLPYVEQGNLYNQFIANQQSPQAATWSTGQTPASPGVTRVQTYICPSSPAIAPSNGNPGTNYLWCSGSTFDGGGQATSTRANGVITQDGGTKIADITDGTSNTLLASETVPGLADNTTQGMAMSSYASGSITGTKANLLPADLAAILAAGFSKAPLTNNGQQWAWSGTSNSLFSTTAPPNWLVPNCNGPNSVCKGGVGLNSPGCGFACDSGAVIAPAHSLHTGGVNAVLADGSVRFITNTINLVTWQNLGNKKDGVPLNNF